MLSQVTESLKFCFSFFLFILQLNFYCFVFIFTIFSSVVFLLKYLPYPHAQKHAGSPYSCCSTLSCLLFPFWACGPSLSYNFSVLSPSCGTNAFLLKCKAILTSLCMCAKTLNFLFHWDRKLHVCGIIKFQWPMSVIQQSQIP